jgi:hypothetical protein
MNAVGLPARIAYCLAAVPVAGAAGFYTGIWALPKLAKVFLGPEAGIEDYGFFLGAIAMGAGLAFALSMVALTLPWKRRRRRTGRAARVTISCVLVVFASLAFADRGHAVVYDLAFAAWMAYVLAFTVVRYGVRDRAKPRIAVGEAAARPPIQRGSVE